MKNIGNAFLPVWIIVVCFTAFSCGSGSDAGSGHICTAEAVSGLSITVIDSVTQENICIATVTATDGAYNETLEVFPSIELTPEDVVGCRYVGAVERAGTYNILVAKPGYQTALLEDVIVERDVCHVIPEVRVIQLKQE